MVRLNLSFKITQGLEISIIILKHRGYLQRYRGEVMN
jgi:hypothetical protein